MAYSPGATDMNTTLCPGGKTTGSGSGSSSPSHWPLSPSSSRKYCCAAATSASRCTSFGVCAMPSVL